MSRNGIILVLALLGAPAHAQVDMSAPPSEAPSDAPAGQPDQARRDPTITMFDNFSISGVVAGLCKPPDEATMGRFMRNLNVVHHATIRYMRQQMPDKSPKEIGDLLLNRMQNLNRLATSAVQQKGCTDPEMVKLIDTFTVNASLDFTKQP